MKNIRLTVATLGILLSASVPALTSMQTVAADNNPSNPCMVGLLSDMTANGNVVTTKFNIPASCGSRVIGLATYERHNDSSPLSTQRIYSTTEAMYTPGDHTITNTVPDGCFYQEDLWVGEAPQQLADNVHYAYGQNDPYVAQAILAGSKDCLTVPTPVPTPTPTPVATAASVTPAQPTQLVNTGPGNMVAIFAAVTVAGAMLHRTVLRKINSRS